jgi:histone deacetylase 6
MPTGMDQLSNPSINPQRLTSPPPTTVPLRAEGQPTLLDAIRLREAGATPDISNAIDQRLNIETSDDTSDDDYSSYETSLDEPDDGKEIVFGLPLTKLPTGLCYDERMRYHAEVQAIEGENIHPEDPRRIYYIYKYLCEAGLVADDNGKRLKTMANPPLYRIDAREATMAECCKVHTKDHYEFIKRTQCMKPASSDKDEIPLLTQRPDLSNEILIEMSDETRADSIYYNQLSYFSSKLSAGGAIETCKAVMNGTVKNAIAVIRPPGHHAEVAKPMGFCMFNNVCIASRICQESFGERCRKILIVDWDVHHGNGCQNAFYDDPNILYISVHVHMDGMFYPSGPDGAADKVGRGPGEGMYVADTLFVTITDIGRNVNIPWKHKGMGDGDYMYAFQQIVMPIAHEFDPDFVIVAAGFDAAAGDELGGCFVTPPCYAHMTHMLKSLAGGKIAVCLEGGYNFHAIAKSALAVTKVLMGEPPDRMGATGPTEEARRTVREVKGIQSQYWRCLWPKG